MPSTTVVAVVDGQPQLLRMLVPEIPDGRPGLPGLYGFDDIPVLEFDDLDQMQRLADLLDVTIRRCRAMLYQADEVRVTTTDEGQVEVAIGQYLAMRRGPDDRMFSMTDGSRIGDLRPRTVWEDGRRIIVVPEGMSHAAIVRFYRRAIQLGTVAPRLYRVLLEVEEAHRRGQLTA